MSQAWSVANRLSPFHEIFYAHGRSTFAFGLCAGGTSAYSGRWLSMRSRLSCAGRMRIESPRWRKGLAPFLDRDDLFLCQHLLCSFRAALSCDAATGFIQICRFGSVPEFFIQTSSRSRRLFLNIAHLSAPFSNQPEAFWRCAEVVTDSDVGCFCFGRIAVVRVGLWRVAHQPQQPVSPRFNLVIHWQPCR